MDEFDHFLIGCHIPMSKPNYLVGSLELAQKYNANCFMIYTGSPQTSIRINLEGLKVEEFHSKLKKTNISSENIIVHAPYILNLCTNALEKINFNLNFIQSELIRSAKIGSKYFVIHPGNSLNFSIEESISNVGIFLNRLFSIDKSQVVVCLETMSGKGSEIGKSFEEISSIINLVKDKKRIGVCLDTCHLNDAGYRLDNFDELLCLFDKVIGLNYLHVVHLNDSKNILGSRKDRHENIGYGTIGFDTLYKIAHHSRLAKIPKILETPWRNGKPIYKEEISLLRRKK